MWAGKGWSIQIVGAEMAVTTATGVGRITDLEAPRFEVRRRWLRWSLYDDGRPVLALRGIASSGARELSLALRRLALNPAIAAAVTWHGAVTSRIADARHAQRWIPTEAVAALAATRPPTGLLKRVREAGLDTQLAPDALLAVHFGDVDLDALVAMANNEIADAELASNRSFFDSIEKSPLTDEQAHAVVCFDNRVQVLAAAGSGKTSVMVARAAYAVSRGFVAPDRILLLAFNKAAALELEERVTARFAAAGIDSTGVRASTFHSFGLDVIGAATGSKPRLADWLGQGDELRVVMEIVDELRDRSEEFRYRWDLYRTLFANASTDITGTDPDGYDASTGAGYRTYGGEIVKSEGERTIANFLYLNGVHYLYERPYDVDLSDPTHSQYRPDFFYPDIGVWHEHWALDRDGNPPTEFRGYAESMAWKRKTHAHYGSTLVESNWADVVFGDGLSKLRDDLTRLGLSFDWNPDRPSNNEWAKPMKHEDLAKLVRTFMTHVKSNSWTSADIDARLAGDQSRLAGYRTRLFLDVYWQIHTEWQRRLDADGVVDFEDMLVLAADCLETGRVSFPYELIMVDEFQDASRARARLVRGLVRNPGRHLLAVGDDWQSINRFAGADISVMTQFEEWFGRGQQVALTTTFRCPQTICDVASTFVSRNPSQFKKAMRSSHTEPGPAVAITRAAHPAHAVASYLNTLSAAVADGSVPAGPGGTVSVEVLGRYRFQRDVMPRHIPKNLRVTFRTIHGSKGLEADYIVIAGVSTGTYGFPSTIADDPVLDLAMPAPEAFPHAEERRLLYVALTRARRQVTLLTDPARMSPFVVELLKQAHVTIDGAEPATVKLCPLCGKGTLVQRTGKWGPFLGCSTFPACTHTAKL